MATLFAMGAEMVVRTRGREGVEWHGEQGVLHARSFGFSVLWDLEALGYLTVWAGNQLVEGGSFEAENKIDGPSEPASYDADTGVLLLGPPAVFTKDNVDDHDF